MSNYIAERGNLLGRTLLRRLAKATLIMTMAGGLAFAVTTPASAATAVQIDSANELKILGEPTGRMEVHITYSCDPVDLSANFETKATDQTSGVGSGTNLNLVEPCTSQNINRTFIVFPDSLEEGFHTGDTVTVTVTLIPSATGIVKATATRTLVLG
ncbi:hypothetical protein [Kitasatospora sp. NPDC094016]|uniref:hypothetical protein n=1 Tax=Kitasatospora sp. NPDC094016 TaxID=3154986 RepID=UPI00332F8369